MSTEQENTTPEENPSEIPEHANIPEGTDMPEDANINITEDTDIQEDTNIPEATDIQEDTELFADDVHEELSERQVFIGDEDFYKSLEEHTKLQNLATDDERPKTGARRMHFSTAQKGLAAGILVTGAALLFMVLKSPPSPSAGSPPSTPDQQTLPERQTASSESPAADSTKAVSLKVAHDFYQQEEYDKAYATYDSLCQILHAKRIAPNHKDLLSLRMALCRMNSGAPEQAERLLDKTAKSRSYVVRVMTNYHRSLLEMQRKQYLNARTRAYQAIALIDAIDTNKDLSSSLQSDCYFLVAESMTRNVLSLCDADADLPSKRWSNSAEIDPFVGLNHEQLETLLNSGSDYLNEGLLGPQIRKIEDEDGSPRWSVVCNGAPVEELLARFAANAGLDITRPLSSAQAPQGKQDTARKKPVTLYLPAATTQQVIAVAAGQAGLLARMHESNTVSIVHPDEYSSLSEHISLLHHETVILWQRFLIAFHNDKRIADAHFALGLLHARQGNTPEAIAEYKLVANRFSRSSLAPYALLHSSRLKASLLDYAGARWDLKQLVEQYPDSEITGRAYVCLAENTARAGPQLKSEAATLYRKVYNLGLSSQSQSTAAFGAAKCCYEIQDYEAAANWLTRYINLPSKQSSKDLGSAYLLLGRTYLALEKPTQACRALQYALARQLSREDYAETVSALINAYAAQKQFVQALDVLENIDSWQFSQKESGTILLLKSRILQQMGLVDKAFAELGDQAEYISDPLLKAQISFELANCHIAKGRLELAHKKLTEILVAVKPGPLAYKVTLKLAEVCLSLGRNAQAISVCSQLWDSAASQQTKHQAAKMLATAYDRLKNYDRAALALLGQPK